MGIHEEMVHTTSSWYDKMSCHLGMAAGGFDLFVERGSIFVKSLTANSQTIILTNRTRKSHIYFRPEGLGSMPDAAKYPPSTHGVRARKISGSEVLWAESRAPGLENISLPFSFMQKLSRWGYVVSPSIIPLGISPS
ncbi:hypothetical protein TNCV_4576661 [Trichonephila clavipes]|nr:hypothetical protein TNCV_4576661 [Trichonephila clavipes]